MTSSQSAAGRASRQAFLGVSALLFAASAVGTIVWCRSMSDMGGMPMPGGWMMSMMWMRMPGQTWPGIAAAFVGMWIVMMVAMMLPSLMPMLWRYREAIAIADSGSGVHTSAGATARASASASASASRSGSGAASRTARIGRLTAIVGLGYFAIWTAFGIVTFPSGVALAELEMRHESLSRAVPIAIGIVILLAGAIQFTAWKAHALDRCRELPPRGSALPADAGAAWRHGLRLGLHCTHACAGPMAMLLALGVMDLSAMALVTALITTERLAPSTLRVARAIGVIMIATGLFLIARALWLA